MKPFHHIQIITLSTISLFTQLQASNTVETLRNTVKEWVAVEKSTSAEAAEWAERKTLLNDLIQVTQAEIQALQTSIADLEATQSTADTVRQDLLTQSQEFDNYKATILTTLAEIEPQLTALKPRLPHPLRKQLNNFYQRLPQDASTTKLSIGERMQTILSILTALQTFNQNISIHDELHTLPDGRQGQIQTIYIGLGNAYYRTPTGQDAGIGYATNNGWQWDSQPQLATAIETVIAIAEQSTQDARFIPLPVSLQN